MSKLAEKSVEVVWDELAKSFYNNQSVKDRCDLDWLIKAYIQTPSLQEPYVGDYFIVPHEEAGPFMLKCRVKSIDPPVVEILEIELAPTQVLCSVDTGI